MPRQIKPPTSIARSAARCCSRRNAKWCAAARSAPTGSSLIAQSFEREFTRRAARGTSARCPQDTAHLAKTPQGKERYRARVTKPSRDLFLVPKLYSQSSPGTARGFARRAEEGGRGRPAGNPIASFTSPSSVLRAKPPLSVPHKGKPPQNDVIERQTN